MAQRAETVPADRSQVRLVEVLDPVRVTVSAGLPEHPLRSGERLSRAIRELRHLWNEIETFYRTTKLADGLIGLRNAIEVALLVADAAQHNRQSRGCHYRRDSVSIEGDRLI